MSIASALRRLTAAACVAAALSGCTGRSGSSEPTHPVTTAAVTATIGAAATDGRTVPGTSPPAAQVGPKTTLSAGPDLQSAAGTRLQDQQQGERLRVSVTGGCPASTRNIVGVSNPASDLDNKLVPAQQPVHALICRYSGPQSGAYQLTDHRLVAAATARRLAELASRVEMSYDRTTTVQSCGGGDGARAIVAFGYSTHPDVDVWLDLTFARPSATATSPHGPLPCLGRLWAS